MFELAQIQGTILYINYGYYKNQWWFIIKKRKKDKIEKGWKKIKINKNNKNLKKIELLGVHLWTVWIDPKLFQGTKLYINFGSFFKVPMMVHRKRKNRGKEKQNRKGMNKGFLSFKDFTHGVTFIFLLPLLPYIYHITCVSIKL